LRRNFSGLGRPGSRAVRQNCSTIINGACKDGFTPNWFLPFSLGGLGFPNRYPERKVVITEVQRKVATYLFEHPLERFIREKLDEELIPYSVDLSIRKLRKMVGKWKVLNVPFEGPLQATEDYASIVNERFSLILRNNAWAKDPRIKDGTHPALLDGYEGSGYKFKNFVQRVLRQMKGKPTFSAAHIKRLTPPRARIVPLEMDKQNGKSFDDYILTIPDERRPSAFRSKCLELFAARFNVVVQ